MMSIAAAYVALSNKGALLTWTPSTSTDVAGYEVWIAARSGGPYAKAHPGLIHETEWISEDLRYGTHFFVVTAVDKAENRSPMSNEVSITID